MKDRIKRLARVKASDLEPHPLNWRRHPAAQESALRAAIERLGFIGAVIARETDGGQLQIIDGHLRAGISADEKVPVLVVDLSEAEAREAIATLDPLGAMAEQDSELLAQLFKILAEEEATLHRLVWPDYVIDPLTTANWDPPPVADEESKTADFGHHQMPKLTDDQYRDMTAAISHARQVVEDPTLPDGAALAFACRRFIELT